MSVSGKNTSWPGSDHFQLIVSASMMLAARLFPDRSQQPIRRAGAYRDAHFLLSGHHHLWPGYEQLDKAEKIRLGRLIHHRPARLAILKTFSDSVSALWSSTEAPNEIAEFDDEHFMVTLYDPDKLAAQVDLILDYLDQEAAEVDARYAKPPALNGAYWVRTPIPDPSRRGNGVIRAHYKLTLDEQADQPALADFGDPVECERISIPVDELRDIAARLDAAFNETYRSDSLDRILSHLRNADGSLLQGGLLTVDAGLIRVLNACTGSGKSVLMRLIALWMALRDMSATMLVTHNSGVLAVVQQLRAELDVLNGGTTDDLVAPLISPRNMQNEAEKFARDFASQGRAEQADAAFSEFAYGCALQAKSTNDEDVDLWEPGQEQCFRLEGVNPETGEFRKFHCPWYRACGKHRHQLALESARIVVTTHINFMSGRIYVPVQVEGVQRNSMTVEEALIRRSHMILIDEVDSYQANEFSKSAHDVLLAKHGSRQPSDLRKLDAELGTASGSMMYELDRHVRPKITLATHLAESYVVNSAEGRLAQAGLGRKSQQVQARNQIIVPRKWDSWCTARLWRTVGGASPSAEAIGTFRLLFNASEDVKLDPAEVPVIPGVADTVDRLSALREIITATTTLRDGEDPVFHGAHQKIKAAIDGLVDPSVTSQERSFLIDLLIRRAYLERIRAMITYVTEAGAPLREAGVTTANELVEMLEDQKRWRSAPYGPLGAPVFGFGAVHDTEHKQRTELHLTSFTGDPHASIVQLGETTALAHCGQRRIVMGFSATAYMPGGTMHHLIVEPTWYVPDDITGRLVIRKLTLVDEDNNPIQISGTADLDRDRAHQTMGRSLWKHASQQLRKLASNPQSAHRARMLIAVTSYQGCWQLAEGMIGAGANPEDIAVAARADEIDNPMRRKPVWCEIASGSLARFGQHPTAKILIAPLAVAERGLNMVDRQGRSLVGQVILAVRPIPVMDEPAQLLSLISGRAYSEDDPTAEPADRLKQLSYAATHVREELFRSHYYFQSLPDQVRRSIVAEMLIGIIQLGGRVRRGGDIGYIYLADYAFHDKSGKSDLPRLINELVTEWTDNQQLALIQAVYGNTFKAIIDFADRK